MYVCKDKRGALQSQVRTSLDTASAQAKELHDYEQSQGKMRGAHASRTVSVITFTISTFRNTILTKSALKPSAIKIDNSITPK